MDDIILWAALAVFFGLPVVLAGISIFLSLKDILRPPLPAKGEAPEPLGEIMRRIDVELDRSAFRQ